MVHLFDDSYDLPFTEVMPEPSVRTELDFGSTSSGAKS